MELDAQALLPHGGPALQPLPLRDILEQQKVQALDVQFAINKPLASWDLGQALYKHRGERRGGAQLLARRDLVNWCIVDPAAAMDQPVDSPFPFLKQVFIIVPSLLGP